MMTPKRVLVTGGTGFIDRGFVRCLLEACYDVTSFGPAGELPDASWNTPVRMVYGGLRNPTDVVHAARDADVIIHLAAVVGVPGAYQMQWDIIAEGTRIVCEAAGPRRTRLVIVSSIAVYGDLIQQQTCRESDGHGAWQGSYGRAKQGQEEIAAKVCSNLDLPLTIIRPANIYGFGGSGAGGDKLLEFVKATGGAVVGDAHINNAGLVHVENLADAIVLAATKKAAIGETHNVCDTEPVT